MAVIEEFLGKRVEIPDALRYHINQGFWVKAQNEDLVFGLTEPALILAGGINDLDWLVTEGQNVSVGESIVFAITGKIWYIEAPTNGKISFNSAAKAKPSLVLEDPYGQGWMFKIKPGKKVDDQLMHFATSREYLRQSRVFQIPKPVNRRLPGFPCGRAGRKYRRPRGPNS